MIISSVATRVSINRDTPEEAVFQYTVEVKGVLSSKQREELQNAMTGCPVRQTLSRHIKFQQRDVLP